MARLYHTTESGSVAGDWRGIQHARMPRSTFHVDVSPSAFKLLAAIRRVLRDGETRDDISNEAWSRHAGMPESTVVVAMRELQRAGLIRREPRGRGRGSVYATTLLPPPEIVVQQARPFSAPEKGSESDPFVHEPNPGSETPQSPESKGSESDPSILIDHACMQQQHAAPSGQSDSAKDPDRPEEVFLQDWLLIRQANPGYSASDFYADMAIARARADVRSPVRFVVGLRRRGEPIYSSSEIAERAGERPSESVASPPNDPELPPKRRRRRQHQRNEDPYENWRHIQPAEPTEEDYRRCAELGARARQLAPAGADELDVLWLMEYLEQGASDEEALARLRQHHAQALDVR